jgi:hypothetical protein
LLADFPEKMAWEYICTETGILRFVGNIHTSEAKDPEFRLSLVAIPVKDRLHPSQPEANNQKQRCVEFVKKQETSHGEKTCCKT